MHRMNNWRFAVPEYEIVWCHSAAEVSKFENLPNIMRLAVDNTLLIPVDVLSK